MAGNTIQPIQALSIAAASVNVEPRAAESGAATPIAATPQNIAAARAAAAPVAATESAQISPQAREALRAATAEQWTAVAASLIGAGGGPAASEQIQQLAAALAQLARRGEVQKILSASPNAAKLEALLAEGPLVVGNTGAAQGPRAPVVEVEIIPAPALPPGQPAPAPPEETPALPAPQSSAAQTSQAPQTPAASASASPPPAAAPSPQNPLAILKELAAAAKIDLARATPRELEILLRQIPAEALQQAPSLPPEELAQWRAVFARLAASAGITVGQGIPSALPTGNADGGATVGNAGSNAGGSSIQVPPAHPQGAAGTAIPSGFIPTMQPNVLPGAQPGVLPGGALAALTETLPGTLPGGTGPLGQSGASPNAPGATSPFFAPILGNFPSATPTFVPFAAPGLAGGGAAPNAAPQMPNIQTSSNAPQVIASATAAAAAGAASAAVAGAGAAILGGGPLPGAPAAAGAALDILIPGNSHQPAQSFAVHETLNAAPSPAAMTSALAPGVAPDPPARLPALLNILQTHAEALTPNGAAQLAKLEALVQVIEILPQTSINSTAAPQAAAIPHAAQVLAARVATQGASFALDAQPSPQLESLLHALHENGFTSVRLEMREDGRLRILFSVGSANVGGAAPIAVDLAEPAAPQHPQRHAPGAAQDSGARGAADARVGNNPPTTGAGFARAGVARGEVSAAGAASNARAGVAPEMLAAAQQSFIRDALGQSAALHPHAANPFGTDPRVANLDPARGEFARDPNYDVRQPIQGDDRRRGSGEENARERARREAREQNRRDAQSEQGEGRLKTLMLNFMAFAGIVDPADVDGEALGEYIRVVVENRLLESKPMEILSGKDTVPLDESKHRFDGQEREIIDVELLD